ncbi:MAG TPA: hypothetical protein VGI78_26415 [Acetobacteraceae bacterium]
MIGVASAAALLLSIGLLWARRIDTATQLCALQALSAAVSLGQVAPTVAILAFALNGVALPLAIARLHGATMLQARGAALLSWTVALALMALTGMAFAGVGTDGLVAAGASVALLGLLLIAFRAHPLAPVLGFLSSQNGLVMLAGAQSELALPTALAVALPLVPALVLAESWQRQ